MGRPRKFIVLVDCHLERLYLRSFVLETRGWRVCTFETPMEAVGFLERTPGLEVDLVAAEYLLPQMDGKELARAVKRLRPQVPVLLFSTALAAMTPADLGSDVNAFLPREGNSSAEFIERARLLCAKKRGPKPFGSMTYGTHREVTAA